MSESSQVFPALLKYWRRRRGLSQLDLALTAEVSARHVSFLETGRSKPSKGMVLLLGSVLDVPLREQNVMLREAGFAPHFPEPALDALGDPGVQHALDAMLQHHAPFPMFVLDRAYNVLRMNTPARCMIESALGNVPVPLNVANAFFGPDGFKASIENWEAVAKSFIGRLHREVLQAPNDARLSGLLEEVLGYPDIPEAWRTPDLTTGSESALTVRVQASGEILTFVVAMMAFHAPQNVTLEEIQIEAYFPGDAQTAALCAHVFGG
ncbi:MAG: helix-turn-helix transcriptional regulator [Bacteroidota bacterium]